MHRKKRARKRAASLPMQAIARKTKLLKTQLLLL
jgi:hypothetical protein